MRVHEAIRKMLERSGRPAYAVSEEIGLSRSNLSNRLNRRVDIGAGSLAAIARSCGYRLMLIGYGEAIEIDPKGVKK